MIKSLFYTACEQTLLCNEHSAPFIVMRYDVTTQASGTWLNLNKKQLAQRIAFTFDRCNAVAYEYSTLACLFILVVKMHIGFAIVSAMSVIHHTCVTFFFISEHECNSIFRVVLNS